MSEAKSKKNKSIYSYIIVAAVFLFNPNISVIDVLPDFVAYFLLAKAFIFAADCAPHFEEARIAFKRLGWLNLSKFLGLLIILLVRRGDSSDGDIVTLVTFVFAVCEVLLTLTAIKHIFNALFYLGNRSDAMATIRPFTAFGHKVRPETVRILSFFFASLKCFTYFIPTSFLLTNVNATAISRARVIKWFFFTLFSTQIICIVAGIIWLCLVRKYALAIKNEGKFNSTLEKLLENNKDFSYERKQTMRGINSALTAFSIASIFTLELALIENYDVNMIPHFIYAAILLVAVCKMSHFLDSSIFARISGIVYLTVSVVAYAIQSYFLTEYGYSALITNKEARSFYPIVTALAVIEFISLAVFLFFISRLLHSFIIKHTGINENSADLKSNEGYYGALIKKNFTYLIAGIAAGLIKLISVIMHGSVKLVYSDNGDELKAAIVSPAVEWIGLAVAVFAFIYIGITLYFFSTLKDEVKMKYEKIDPYN